MPEIFVAPRKEKKRKEKSEKPKVESGGFFNQAKTAFSAFVSLPKDVHFENQEDGEVVILLLRRHWILNIHWIVISVLALFAPTIIFPALSFFKVFNYLPLKFQLVGLFSWYILTFSYFFVSFASWYFNVYIITNRRIIDVDFLNLLYKEISTCTIDKIQDVTYKVGGTLGIFFDFGTVFIQTAAEEENIEFELIPKPALVSRKITELMGESPS